ncbi:hypothetical protein VMCG_01597 [Cytospora schulzeri]|uniref:DNA (cytosine-5-)-methyltransferase n=1 Tax=Cytospora schulzeri TaxID=448051 RepID=A0A423X3X9_9PEZI|nr:hypothetical protein VMCG_01597 [Valsa malicola]
MPTIDHIQAPGGSEEQPITIEDDENLSEVCKEVQELLGRVQDCGPPPAPPASPSRLLKIEEEDENLSEDPWAEDEAAYDKDNELIEAIDLPVDPEPEPQPQPQSVKAPVIHGNCKHWKKGIRNPCRCGTHESVTHAYTPDFEFETMQCVELKVPLLVGGYQAEFLEVCEIFYPRNDGGDVFVRGIPYGRTRNLDGRFNPHKNEVCALLEIDTNDERNIDLQALVEVLLETIKTVRILHKTNKSFPECRFDPVIYKTREDREAKGPLTCRWVFTRTYPDVRYRMAWRPVDGEELRHYNEADVTKDRHRASDDERLTKWRNGKEKVPGGSYLPKGTQKAKTEPEPDPVTENNPKNVKILPGQKYSVVDVFSGAGGFSKGVEMAGFKVLTACDHWEHCCATYRENFPETHLHEKDVYQFITDHETNLTIDHQEPVDFVHMSPPCQFYSPAHTVAGKNDKANMAALFTCQRIIRIYRPRLFSVEQTFGLAQARHRSYFNALIQGFTSHGYSVKWKVFHLVEFGLPQTRKRLLMIGAAPGETLPDWPEPTHSREPPTATGAQQQQKKNENKNKNKKKPLVTAVQACSTLVPGVNLHDVQGARPIDRTAWDGTRPLERTITTSGGQCYHWSGLRDLTLAEFAALQGFPADFRFRSKYVKKQIGNAFPPIVVKAIMKQIRRHLERVDGCERLPEPGSVIVLDDDDEDVVVNDNHKPVQSLDDKDKTSHHDTLDIHEKKDTIVVATPETDRRKSQSQSRRASRRQSKTTGRKTSRRSTTTPKKSEVLERQRTPPTHEPKSTADCITCLGDSPRAGSSRQQPIILDDDDDDDDDPMGEAEAEVETQRADAETRPRIKPHVWPSCRSGASATSLGMVRNLAGFGMTPFFGYEEAWARLRGGAGVHETVAGPSSRRETIGTPGERRDSERDADLWRGYVGDLDEDAAMDIAMGNSVHEARRSLDGQGTIELVDDGVIHYEGKGKGKGKGKGEGKGKGNGKGKGKGNGKGKEVVRTFAQYDDGQDNESPQGSPGGAKRPRIG